MTTTRDYGTELDTLQAQMNDLQQLVRQLIHNQDESYPMITENTSSAAAGLGSVFYSGQYRGDQASFRWEPQEKHVRQLIQLDGDKAAKILGALAHKQRLDILRAVLQEPLTGPDLVERLNMGTTGQLYHHIKALVGADLLVQEERGGKYTIPGPRALPLLLLLAAASDLMDTSDYLAMTDARTNAHAYLGGAQDIYDPHLLLWAVVENCILEHLHGTCSEVSLFLHADGSITVADNGRGIPVQALPGSEHPRVQTVLTDMSRLSASATFLAPGSEKGISMPVVNALSLKLSVEIRRDGRVFQQHYKHGIPQSELQTVGVTKETGTSVTFLPDRDIFSKSFELSMLEKQAEDFAVLYPKLHIQVWSDLA
ncbi:helix-turn-helix domain-containing protein [Paenibacillus alginolyticus]|uniref:DNA topoisomerase (ATP-hydrolyzing) n=2 Tax=Paenibacillus alginolyticus TaxID=59839 RepID=A0ABT4GKP1_9BACL|nr:ATP-binding protein [Paenibacillus alginolyticus]MCY9696730.1 helix-turn-helix domain-containing protein [Paenibacillus alginolyticus]MEC0147578.1 helix-turn-helix domain-containing protein [Paenibacillus alginolyticus]